VTSDHSTRVTSHDLQDRGREKGEKGENTQSCATPSVTGERFEKGGPITCSRQVMREENIFGEMRDARGKAAFDAMVLCVCV
jgi:hypothetical protein